MIGSLVALWFRISLRVIGLIMAFGAGVLISAVAADTMMPEAFEHGGNWVGVATTLGFAVAFTIRTLD